MAKYDIAFQPYHLFGPQGIILHPSQMNPAGYISPAHEAMANKRPWWQSVIPTALKRSYIPNQPRAGIASLPVNPMATHVNGAY